MAFGLFKKKEAEPLTEDAATDRLDAELAEEARLHARDRVELDVEVITPARIGLKTKDSESSEPSIYDYILTKDIALQFTKPGDEEIWEIGQAIIDNLLSKNNEQLADLALMFRAELIGWYLAKSSIGGEGRKALVTSITKQDKKLFRGDKEPKPQS